MIGVVLVTHGNLATEFREAMEHVVGPQDQLATITIGPDDDMEIHRAGILKAIEKVDTGEGTILLTDMFGGTPSNLAISIMEKANVEVVAGVNLPMLIKLASVRSQCTLKEAAEQTLDAGRKYINIASHLLAGEG